MDTNKAEDHDDEQLDAEEEAVHPNAGSGTASQQNQARQQPPQNDEEFFTRSPFARMNDVRDDDEEEFAEPMVTPVSALFQRKLNPIDTMLLAIGVGLPIATAIGAVIFMVTR
jgi:hypothetical protein